MLLNSPIVAVGDIILSQRVRHKTSCGLNPSPFFLNLRQSLATVPSLHENQRHQFSYRPNDDDLPEPYTCFGPRLPPPPFSSQSIFGEEIVLSSSDPAKRRQKFAELRRLNTTSLQTGGDKSPPVGWISHQTSSVTASTMFWNPETEFLFEVDFKWFFSANGILRSDVDFRGVQLKSWKSPSPVFSVVLSINMIWLLFDIGRRVRQSLQDNPEKRDVRAGRRRCRCLSHFQARDKLATLLICMQLMLIIMDALILFLAWAFNDFELSNHFAFAYDLPFWYCEVTDPQRKLLCTMTKIHDFSSIVLSLMLFLYGMKALFSFRLIPRMGALVMSFLYIILEAEVLMYVLLWILMHLIFGIVYHTLVSNTLSRYSTGFSSIVASFETGLNLGSLFLEMIEFNEAEMDDSEMDLTNGDMFTGAIVHMRYWVVTLVYFVWMLFSVIMVNLLIGIITQRYPELQNESKEKWEEIVTKKMALKVRLAPLLWPITHALIAPR